MSCESDDYRTHQRQSGQSSLASIVPQTLRIYVNENLASGLSLGQMHTHKDDDVAQPEQSFK